MVSHSVYNYAVQRAVSRLVSTTNEEKIAAEIIKVSPTSAVVAAEPRNLNHAVDSLVDNIKGKYISVFENEKEKMSTEEYNAALGLLYISRDAERPRGLPEGGAKKKTPAKKAPAKKTTTKKATTQAPKGIPALPRKRTTTKRA
jgi:hypothetical protein